MTYYHHSIVDSPHLPRDLAVDSTQSLLVMMLGEFWPHQDPPWIPSAAVVEIMGHLGATEAATRAAMSRLGQRGTLVAQRQGRRTSCKLSAEVLATIPASEHLTMTFGATAPPWSGEWTMVIFSIPDDQRDRRDMLRAWLRWFGFGPWRDGVWLSPSADIGPVLESIADLFPQDGLIIRTREVVGSIDPATVWKLEEIRSGYTAFLERFRPEIYRFRAGDVAPVEALSLMLRLIGWWRRFPAMDPNLPSCMLPADWPTSEARRIFIGLYDAGMPVAARMVARVVARHDASAAEAVIAEGYQAKLQRLTERMPSVENRELDVIRLGPRRPQLSEAS